MSKTVATEIDARGGPAAFAKAIGSTPGNVRAWKHRGQIPRTWWPEIVDAFSDLTLDALKGLERQAAVSE